jgi:hypothetical protein
MEKPTRYVVKREAGGCKFVPPPLFGRSMAGMYGAGSVYLVYVSAMFFQRTATAILGAILLLVAARACGPRHLRRTGIMRCRNGSSRPDRPVAWRRGVRLRSLP